MKVWRDMTAGEIRDEVEKMTAEINEAVRKGKDSIIVLDPFSIRSKPQPSTKSYLPIPTAK